MSIKTLFNCEKAVSHFDIDVPAWIEQDIRCDQVAAIIQGGCDSGAYMPAVERYTALETMHEHGDDIFDFLEEHGIEYTFPEPMNWGTLAVQFVTLAVERWAFSIDDELSNAVENEPQWVAGWNTPGYLPDSEPEEFATFEDAREYLLDEIAFITDDENVSDDDPLNVFYDRIKASIDEIELRGPNGVVYWAKRIQE